MKLVGQVMLSGLKYCVYWSFCSAYVPTVEYFLYNQGRIWVMYQLCN